MDLGLGPKEGRCGVIVTFDEGVDVGDEVFDAGEGCAGERLRGQNREPDFDLAQPGSMGGRVVEMNVLVTLEPPIAPRLVGGEIVDTTWILRSGYAATTRFMKSRNSTRRRLL